jgi:hypothetical protein
VDYIRSEAEVDKRLSITKGLDDAESKRIAEAAQIRRIVHDTLDAYERQGRINHAGGANLSSQQHIVEIIQTLRMILFPGYYDRGAIEETALPYITGEREEWAGLWWDGG